MCPYETFYYGRLPAMGGNRRVEVQARTDFSAGEGDGSRAGKETPNNQAY